MKQYISFSILLFLFSIAVYSQKKEAPKEILLIGVFHFNNPGADLAKTEKFNVMTQESQAELENINSAIKHFAPDKVFTEWNYNEQSELDSLYNLYVKNQYFDYVSKKYPGNLFFKENEIFQLGFRIAKTNKHKKVYGIDLSTPFPFDSVMVSIEKAHQNELKEKIFERIKKIESNSNTNRQKYNLTTLLIESNKQNNRNFDLGSYITLFNPAGKYDDFTGADLVASWYRRNLLMYSLVQKSIENKDKRLVVILGSGHIALFKHFIDLDENYKVIELNDILNR